MQNVEYDGERRAEGVITGGEGTMPSGALWWEKTASGTHMVRKRRDLDANRWCEREGRRLDGRTGEGSPVDGESRERGSQRVRDRAPERKGTQLNLSASLAG